MSEEKEVPLISQEEIEKRRNMSDSQWLKNTLETITNHRKLMLDQIRQTRSNLALLDADYKHYLSLFKKEQKRK